uniref:Mobile element protein n=1 Tax=Heterorhabditis bacteriophora TaxID=37862 RepID=A0A1I7X900_HETBA
MNGFVFSVLQNVVFDTIDTYLRISTTESIN